MQIKLFFIRKIKSYFLRFKLHILFNFCVSFFKNLVYLSEFSKWTSKHRKLPFNDFFSSKFDSGMRYKIFEFIKKTELADDSIDYLEFGVAYGNTMRWWSTNIQNPSARFFGFDTFEGLPEDWHLFQKGEMSPGGVFPDINDKRIQYFKGLFQETLLPFLKNYDNSRRKVIHIDADLYSSTLFVLTMLAPYLRKNDIIIFDEFGVPTHEFKAFTEFISSYYLEYEVLAAGNNYFQLTVKITKSLVD